MIKRKIKGSVKIIKEITYPLTLDPKWHALFSGLKTRKMKELEHKLNNLLKNQGQFNIDYKEYTQLKKKLMEDILGNMPEAFEDSKDPSNSNMGKNKRYIEQINLKLAKLEKKLISIPEEIKTVNHELLVTSMALCHNKMTKSKDTLGKMDQSILKLRDELKETICKKDEIKVEYNQMYGFMHDVVGPQVMEQFDNMYLGGNGLD